MSRSVYRAWSVAVCAALVALAPQARSAVEADKTLSPYFAIENGDPAVDRFPLKRTNVDATISGVIAHVLVTQTYVNDGTRPITAKYVFPASTRASVHGMKMTIGEHVITAKIREREKAQQEFDEAKKAGKSASLLQQHRPNVFSVDVANVMPGDTIDIELRYTELLVPTDGTYEFVYPTVVGPRYSELTEDTATDADQWVKSPYLPEGEESPMEFGITVKLSTGIPLQEIACTSHEVDVTWQGEKAASVSLKPTERHPADRDVILRYRLTGRQIESGLMLYEGEDENFFLLMAQPPERVTIEHIPPREYVFIVDVSGSMNGFPISVSKELLRSLIGSLRPTDTFNVILFAGTSSTMSPLSLPATAANIRNAIALIEKQQGGGGTRLLSAMQTAFSMAHDENRSRSLIVVTDGYIAAERDVFVLIKESLNNANVFAFGIGSSVNRHLIEGVARAGRGETFIVTDRHEGPAQSERFRRYVESPVLTGISVEYDGFEVYDVEPRSIPDLLAQRPLLIFGKWRGAAKGAITIKGTGGSGDYAQGFDVSETDPLPENRPLRYLWARNRVAELSDFNFQLQDDEAVREITSLGLTYDLLTRYTSFVAVHDVIRNPDGGGKDVTQPLPLPKGVSNLAVGGDQGAGPQVSCPAVSSPATEVPEPELYILLLLLVAAIAARRMLRRRAA
ncbi:VIT domain-containing protein [Verrucomicrobiota bacterium]